MSEMVPKPVRDDFRQLLWRKADALDWPRRSALERASIYENWAKDKQIGGVLSHYMDPRKIRVYIKDTLMKPYQRSRLQTEFESVLLALEMDSSVQTATLYTQPPGRLLKDGRIVCWGNVRDWKNVIFSVFERAYEVPNACSFAAVLIKGGRPLEQKNQILVQEAASRLGIERVAWLE